MYSIFSLTLLFTPLGDWIELNVAWLLAGLMVTLGSIMMVLIGVVIWAIRLEGTVKQVVKDIDRFSEEIRGDMKSAVEKHDNLDLEFWRHENDPEKHVNKPYMGELAEKVKDLRVSNESGIRRVEDKVDHMVRVLLGRGGHTTEG